MINQALNLINSTGIELTFVGVKSGWALGQLKSGFQTGDIGYVGDRETLARLYGASDIFLFASPAENFPCVILEAMASGCCVVATPSGGVVEQIADGENGLLAADISGESLAAALQRALDSPKEIQTLGENARLTVIERFSEDMMIDEHERLYRSLVGNA
jgi:glycosyltransferase involved in cell wall biosynthesis